ncbi:3-methyl-2-oxobutanoate dehydrogenase (lipoamide) kinase [Lachnellula suecica]|uniref:Protein-serine/threonine kinase n=1 Tax=Lachnellula suecica TaxID=602035 RepID=A0A8T9BYU9_9HELO|nr:3-methyl-2-oxobutanoate dehydrogenase (lipoamide) kinase [Lachnellula suecica]
MTSLSRPLRSCSGRIYNLNTTRRFSQLLRLSRHASPSTQKWSHPPSSTVIADDDVASLASKPLHALSLADLVKHGRPPLSTAALFSSANFTLSLLPIRLAHRIQALRNLPFIVVSNPNISKIYNNYLHSLSTLLPYKSKTISNLEDEIRFTEVLADLVETHAHTIPTLARGFLECRKYIKPEEVTRFLDEHLRARIGTRLIAEQHIALHVSSQPHQHSHSKFHPLDHPSSYIGVIDTALQPATIVNNCGNFVSEICELKYGVRPTWVIDGEPDTTFAYVPVHLEYIITELLKNAFRATVESGRSHEPVVITIAAEPESPIGTLDHSRPLDGIPPRQESEENPSIQPFDDPAPGVTIRIRDRGGGISPDVLPNIWSYSFTTFSDADELPGQTSSSGNMDALNAISGAGGENSSIAGLGYGLPLGRAYAEYFGGGIGVQSLYGWGCDVYLRLKGLGKPKD